MRLDGYDDGSQVGGAVDEPGRPLMALWPWEARHGGHTAFYLRSLVAADWRPNREILPNYVLKLDGTEGVRGETIACGECGGAIQTHHVEIAARHYPPFRDWLARYRQGTQRWPTIGTSPENCFRCNGRLDNGACRQGCRS